MITKEQIIDVKWCCGRDNIGIVLIKNPEGHKAYIGTCTGMDADDDALHIAQSGSKFFYGPALWPNLVWAD